jgi:mitogen-activated protein kinase kinase kinase
MPANSTGEAIQHRTIPLEDLWRHLVKFVNSEDGTSRTVNVSNCTSGLAVLDLVLKKFGKGGSNWNPDSESGDSDRLEWDGWGVFTRKENGEEGMSLRTAIFIY